MVGEKPTTTQLDEVFRGRCRDRAGCHPGQLPAAPESRCAVRWGGVSARADVYVQDGQWLIQQECPTLFTESDTIGLILARDPRPNLLFMARFVLSIDKPDMHLEDFDQDDGKRVWLSRDELELFLERVDGNEKQIALGLAARSGLRTDEVVNVTPADIVTGPADFMVRVQSGKGDKYRETPLPGELAIRIDATTEDHPDDQPLVDRPTRTLRRWTKAFAAECQEQTGDGGWHYLSPHDLRRSWAQALLDAGVEPSLVMHWGGWESWPTFREHYLGVYSVEKQLAEREKVDWL